MAGGGIRLKILILHLFSGLAGADVFHVGFLSGNRNRTDGRADAGLPGVRIR